MLSPTPIHSCHTLKETHITLSIRGYQISNLSETYVSDRPIRNQDSFNNSPRHATCSRATIHTDSAVIDFFVSSNYVGATHYSFDFVCSGDFIFSCELMFIIQHYILSCQNGCINHIDGIFYR